MCEAHVGGVPGMKVEAIRRLILVDWERGSDLDSGIRHGCGERWSVSRCS